MSAPNSPGSQALKDQKTRILIVDDDLDIQDLLQSYYEPRGFDVTCRADPSKPIKELEKGPNAYDLILTDLKMPGMDGLEFLAHVKKLSPEMPIIVMTAHGNVETAVQAIQAGAYDFVTKPIDFPHLNVSIDRALRMLWLQRQNHALRKEVEKTRSFGGIVGKSEAMRRVFDLAKRVANSTANVLINGESGTGKEVIARSIHSLSDRKDAPFIAINCSAIPDNLLESELFGHAKGAFTGAMDKKLGLFEEAEGGVLFLDEIGDMNPSLQTKLLRVLQERKIKRIGENQYRPIDVRLIAATHRDLKAAIADKTFREDLFYRLCVIPIKIPPLRERTDDILPLAHHFLEKFKLQNGSSLTGFTKSALDRLIRMRWSGNVRELENVIERAVVLCRGTEIDAEDLLEFDSAPEMSSETSAELSEAGETHHKPETSALAGPTGATAENTAPVAATKELPAEERLFRALVGDTSTLPTLDQFSQRYVAYILETVSGVREKAAKILDIDRKTLYRRTKEIESPFTPSASAKISSLAEELSQ